MSLRINSYDRGVELLLLCKMDYAMNLAHYICRCVMGLKQTMTRVMA
jgi:hypothetical protein